MASASPGDGNDDPIQTLRSKYSLGFIGNTMSAEKPSSPTRPARIWWWYASIRRSSSTAHATPCSVMTYRRPGKRSKTPLIVRWERLRWAKKGTSIKKITPDAGSSP